MTSNISTYEYRRVATPILFIACTALAFFISYFHKIVYKTIEGDTHFTYSQPSIQALLNAVITVHVLKLSVKACVLSM